MHEYVFCQKKQSKTQKETKETVKSCRCQTAMIRLNRFGAASEPYTLAPGCFVADDQCAY